MDADPHPPPPRPLFDAPGDPRSLRRLEDARFLTGQGRYVDDEPADGQLVALILRSPHAHARIVAIDVAEAAALPGVRGVFTARDLIDDGIGTLPCHVVFPEGQALFVPPRHPLAQGRVRFVGDGVALVVAESRSIGLDALERIAVEYAVLPAVADPAAARAPGAPQLWDGAPGNVAYHFWRGDRERAEAAIAGAAHVVELELVNNRIAAAATEPRVAVGHWDAGSGHYRLFFSGASVHQVRKALAEGVFGVTPETIEVIAPDVGGGFGMKSVTYPEYALLLWAARRFDRPVRWVAERSEDFIAGAHGRANITRARLGLDAEANFLALSVETLGDLGAYVSSGGPGSSTIAPSSAMGGLYAIPAISMDVLGVLTNTAPVDAYRGAGKPEANYIIERLVDLAAHRLGLDPVALRRRNLVRAFPYRTAIGVLVDSGAPAENLALALTAADHAGFPARREASRARGLLRGIGVTCFIETSRGPPTEGGWLRLLADGTIELRVGTQSNGQGHETSFPQLLAGKLGLPITAFRYVEADTRVIPRGGGYGGARSLHMGGTALVLAADDLLARSLPLAARLLQARPEQVAYRDGAFVCTADPPGEARRIDLCALGRALAQSGLTLPAGDGDNPCKDFTFPQGCHIAEVEVDPETGEVSLETYLGVDDFGTLVNPLLTEGQVQGGLAQGIGQALLEEVHYDPESGQMLTATLMDYAIPRADDLPWLRVGLVERPTATNPIGAKGSGQAGAIAAPQCVVNAVLDALRPLGIEHIDMPLTPLRVWQAIRAAYSAAGMPAGA